LRSDQHFADRADAEANAASAESLGGDIRAALVGIALAIHIPRPHPIPVHGATAVLAILSSIPDFRRPRRGPWKVVADDAKQRRAAINAGWQ